ncbi:MAG: GGDEF domain-containing protein, partial [Clostridia bacterium]|nr:GGDEF domain-containing protein [Clostridia bacterium]
MDRRNVAVYVSNIYNYLVRETAESIIESAGRENIKLLFFTSFTDNFSSKQYARYEKYDTGDFAVFLLPDLSRFDALLSLDTHMPVSYIKTLESLKEQSACPAFSLGNVEEKTYSIICDETDSIRAIMDHLIEDHACRHIMHVAGRPEMSFTQQRIDAFRQSMSEHGLPCTDDHIVYGSLREDCGSDVVREILTRSPALFGRSLPDAIACANDFMAIGVIRALTACGFQVPENVIVTGYDDVPRAGSNIPSITTSAQPFTEIGRTGIEALTHLWAGEKPDPVTRIPGILKRRQSCGCEPAGIFKRSQLLDRYVDTVSHLENLVQSNTNLVLGAAAADTLDDLFSEIENSCLRETGFRDAVLCLIQGWDHKQVITSREALEHARFDMVCGLYNGQRITRCTLPEGELLPREMMQDNRPYFIFPVHYLQYFMGYFIVSPDLEAYGQLHIKSWLVSVSNALESYCNRRKLMESVDRLEHLYQTDMLTGLYNRYGFYHFFEVYYLDCRMHQTPLTVFLFDMNHMKTINDVYGHADGDYSLCTIASAMKACALPDDICVRTGGDEFVVLSRHTDDARAALYMRDVKTVIRDSCRRYNKPFFVEVSAGFYQY